MVFMSKSKRLRVVGRPSFHILDANGQRVQISGFTAEFMNGRFETNNPDEIALLIKHPANNVRFAAVDDEGAWMAAHPEYFHKPADMVAGAVATVNTAPLVTATRVPLKKEIATREQIAREQEERVDIDSLIERKVNAALNPLYAKLDKLLGEGPTLVDIPPERSEPAREETPAKRTFTCPVPGCGFVGKTGIEIGAHKRAVHSTEVSAG